jgi:hypothetical protein
VETFVRKTKSNEWLFRKKKPFPMQFYLHIHSIYNRSYGWDALQKHSVKTEVDCMLDGSQKHYANTQKNKGYMQLHKIRQCCKQLSWPNSRQYCNSVQNFVLTQKNYAKPL